MDSIKAKPKKDNLRVLVVIPAYNEEKEVAKVIEQTRSANPQVDIIVINDGSTDGTKGKAKQTGAKVISLVTNLGIGGAVQTGFKYAYQYNYDVVVQIDGDGQHDPKYIKELVLPIVENSADMVIGSRFIEKKGYQSTFLRKLGIKVFQMINLMLIKQNITDSTSGIRAYNKKTIMFLKDNYPVDYPEPEVVILLGMMNLRIKEVPVRMRSRKEGLSSIRGIKPVYYMLKVLLSIMIGHRRLKNG